EVPDLASRTLHWFRWEAFTTWLSGFLLLVLIYYLGGGALIDTYVRDSNVGTAVAFGIGMILACGVVYDVLMLTPLGRNEKAFAAVAYVLIVAVAFILTRVLSARASYIHVGAIFGTIMAAN